MRAVSGDVHADGTDYGMGIFTAGTKLIDMAMILSPPRGLCI